MAGIDKLIKISISFKLFLPAADILSCRGYCHFTYLFCSLAAAPRPYLFLPQPEAKSLLPSGIQEKKYVFGCSFLPAANTPSYRRAESPVEPKAALS